MKILHITKLPDGGASLCAIRICKALIEEGIDSKMLFMQGQPEEYKYIADIDWLYRKHNNILVRILMKMLRLILRPRFEILIMRRKRAERNGDIFFTSPVTAYTNIVKHPLVKEADIVHLHWISDFVDFSSFFKKVDKPIVWTAHDENPGLGGFHYVLQKETASKDFLSLDKEYEKIKRKAVNGNNQPHLIAISEKMQSFFKDNIILKDCPVTLIHNGVDGDSFVKKDKMSCREKLHLPINRKIFLFSSYMIEDKRKGLSLLIDALSSFNNDSFLLVCLGKFDKIPSISSIEIRCEGLIHGCDRLSMYYSAADYFILPSYQEAFAQTPLEAMSCGTPVVAFPCSGIPELINNQNGVICDDFTVESLIRGVKAALKKTYNRDSIRQYVLSNFSYDIIVQKYIKLYNDILTKKQINV